MNEKTHFLPVMSVANLHFGSGAVANITSCCQSEINRVQLEVFCEDRVIVLGSEGNHWTTADSQQDLSKEPSENIDRVFIDAVKSRNSERILSDYSDALKTLRVTSALTHSMNNNNITVNL